MSWEAAGIIVALAMAVTTLAGLLVSWGRNQEKHDALVRRHESCPINTVVTDLAVLKSEVKLSREFQMSLSRHLADAIREKSEPERDILIDKMNHGNISLMEAERLATLLRNHIVEEGEQDRCVSDSRACSLKAVAYQVMLDQAKSLIGEKMKKRFQ